MVAGVASAEPERWSVQTAGTELFFTGKACGGGTLQAAFAAGGQKRGSPPSLGGLPSSRRCSGTYSYMSVCSRLFVHSGLEYGHLLRGEETPLAAFEILLGQAGKVDAVEFRDAVAEVLEYAAHDTVAARVDFDSDLFAEWFFATAS